MDETDQAPPQVASRVNCLLLPTHVYIFVCLDFTSAHLAVSRTRRIQELRDSDSEETYSTSQPSNGSYHTYAKSSKQFAVALGFAILMGFQ